MDVNKRNVLSGHHTHVGIGAALDEEGFRYVEVYLDRYLDLDPLEDIVGPQVVISGKVCARPLASYLVISTRSSCALVLIRIVRTFTSEQVLAPGFGPYAATVYYDDPDERLSVEEAAEKFGRGYPDFSDYQVILCW